MIRITVTLIDGGDESRAREVARADVANISDLAVMSDYRADVIEHANAVARTDRQRCEIEIKEHRRDQTVWALVAEVAAEAAKKFDPRPNVRNFPTHKSGSNDIDAVLDLWAKGVPALLIKERTGKTESQIEKIIARGRERDDPRAVRRNVKGQPRSSAR